MLEPTLTDREEKYKETLNSLYWEPRVVDWSKFRYDINCSKDKFKVFKIIDDWEIKSLITFNKKILHVCVFKGVDKDASYYLVPMFQKLLRERSL